MKAIACPDKLKGTLSARAAAAALAGGFEKVGVEVDEIPLAASGEGTADVLYAAPGAECRTAQVSDARVRQIEGRFLLLPD